MIDVGSYDLGNRRVTVRLDKQSSNGHCHIIDGIIFIGIDGNNWREVIGILLHEAMELAIMDLELRYTPSHDESNSADIYLFIMTHPQFSQVCGRVGNFLYECLPDLTRSYREANRKNRKRRK